MPRQGNIPRVCEQCGKHFKTWPYLIEQGAGRFCSTECANLHRRRPEQTFLSGYATMEVPGRGTIYVHRYVMEQHLGRLLSRDEHVHHINGVKTDNRLENLQLVSAADHQRIHRILPSGTWSQKHVCCVVCGKTDARHYGKGVCVRCAKARQYREAHPQRPPYSLARDGKWSRGGHQCCVICGTTTSKHKAHGLCRNCYRKPRESTLH